ncbi:PD-(D/E)XK nuclease-like domain-containing protein [Bradyrhizobium sp. BRP22]|uniref:PD-(D/E)XK nuclease-like domain-containing protein n=1 Tax=Bradyrhizobium sp. BRP22 TaxID=2793821 RepID=UPI001CD3CC05|nr:PD-(D/E)XK nuclease-like domain-containing protein [Bradyrhizobium sp. BRP22]MCA1452876.1 PD-(D/E)XK nuclease-like domain-containing protein [Bradyrhizobium sp. BRP22]
MIQSIKWDGQQITSPGVYSRLPLDDYHRGDICGGPSVSSTTLRQLWDTSPAHAWAHCALNPQRVEEPDGEWRNIGRAAHHLLTAEIGFADLFVIRPETLEGEKWHGNRKECRRWLAQRKRERLTVLTSANVEVIKGMALSIGAFPLVQAGALNGLIERSFMWRDKETGLWLKARPDAIPSDSGDFTDLKTCKSVLHRDLQKSVGDYSYHQQAALVIEGARALDIEANSFTLIWVEKSPPYCVRATQLKDEDIARGMQQNRVALRTFADCLARGVWPGPGDERDDAEYVDLPDWRRKQIDERLRLQLREAA